MSEIIKIIDEKETQKKRKRKKKENTEKNKAVTEAIVKGWELNEFVVDLS